MTAQPSRQALFFQGQAFHLVSLIALLAGLWAAWGWPGVSEGRFLGLSTTTWAVLAVGDAIIHQVYVWLCWRLELDGGRLTRAFGARAFRLYQAGFTPLIVLRPVLAVALGWSNRGTWALDPWAGVVIAVLLAVPAVWLMVSIRRYFGFERAFGIDHFDPAYRDAPLVRQGIFRWTPNAMYVFGFFALWIPGFLFQSVAALVVAGFSHLYIWVHYFATERPDMKRIYG